MFNIVLFNPQIPNNTGSIGRLCVNTGSSLHLIKPLGFDIDEKAVRRAGLDYWHKLDLHVWEDLDAFFEANPKAKEGLFATTKTDRPYFDASYEEDGYIFFGSETKGIPSEVLQTYPDQCITIPMTKEGRSLNLAISTGIILYEAIKQNYATYEKLM